MKDQRWVDRVLLESYSAQRARSIIKVLLGLPPAQITRVEKFLEGGMWFAPSQAMKQVWRPRTVVFR